MKFFAYQDGVITAEWLVFSVGGGTLKELDEYSEEDIKYYKYTTMHEILEYTERKGISLLDYVLESEPLNILDYARMIIEVMFASVERGLTTEGVLPGALKLKRRAPSFYQKHLKKKDLISLVFASALAVSEENASGNVIVTAPTCGSSGVIPGFFMRSLV